MDNQNIRFVRSVYELKTVKSVCVGLILAGGLCLSKKEIRYDKKAKAFHVLHRIDGSRETLTEKELMDTSARRKTNIGLAMKRNALLYV